MKFSLDSSNCLGKTTPPYYYWLWAATIMVILSVVSLRYHLFQRAEETPLTVLLSQIKEDNAEGFIREGDTLIAKDRGTLTIHMKTQVAFLSGELQLTTSPNAHYKIMTGTSDESLYEVTDDSFFEDYVIDLTPFVKNRNNLLLRIEAERGIGPAKIEFLKLKSEIIKKNKFVFQFVISLTIIVIALILCCRVGFWATRYVTINLMILLLVALFFIGAFPCFHVVNLTMSLFWIIVAMAHWVRKKKKSGSEETLLTKKITSVLVPYNQGEGLGVFLLILGIIFIITSALVFRGWGLNHAETWETEAAGPIMEMTYGISFLFCLVFLMPLRRLQDGCEKGRFSYKWDALILNRALTWVPIGILIWSYFHYGLNQVISNFDYVTPDAQSYFVVIEREWSKIILPTSYRAPLLSYLNKIFYSLYDIPYDIKFMKVTSLYFYLFTILVTIALVKKIYNNRCLALLGAIMALAFIAVPFGGEEPSSYLKQGIRLFPFMFFLTATLYLTILLWGTHSKKSECCIAIAMGVVMSFTCLLRPEGVFIFSLFIGASILLATRCWKGWLVVIFVVIFIYGPYFYLKTSQSEGASNISSTAKAWRNREFQNEIGEPVTPEVRKSLYTGRKVTTYEYFFKMHTLYELVAYSVGGYYRSLITEWNSYLSMNLYTSQEWGSLLSHVRKGLLFVLATLVGLFSLKRKEIMITLIFALIALTPNVFMNHLGASTRHFFHVWPLLIIITLNGMETIFHSLMDFPSVLFRKRYTASYLLVWIVFLFPGIFPEIVTINHTKIFKNNLNNHVRGERFQKYFLPVLNGAGKEKNLTVRKALFPRGKGYLRCTVRNAEKGRVKVEFLGKERIVYLNKKSGEITIPFQTNQVLRSDVNLNFSGMSNVVLPDYIKISSLLKK